MRLIDADNLKDDGCNYVWAETIGFGLVKKEYRFVNRIQIDNTPTVEAIPIEWVKKWVSERNDFPTMPYNQHIWNMLDDWREENGS